jgi:CheY-like chemotaxis protein
MPAPAADGAMDADEAGDAAAGSGSQTALRATTGARGREGADGGRGQEARPTVLLVDDDATIQELVRATLTQAGYAVAVAPDGLAALKLVGPPQSVEPDLILLDLHMPVMDGWTFARAYRQLPGWHAPIIVFSAVLDAADQVARVHAQAVLSKPFDVDELLAHVARYARRHDAP